jgi:hypothetical protein
LGFRGRRASVGTVGTPQELPVGLRRIDILDDSRIGDWNRNYP